MDKPLLSYYEAIKKASDGMLIAARNGKWDHVIKLEEACVLLLSQLKAAYRANQLSPEEDQAKWQIIEHILLNDLEIRQLAEPWLKDLNHMFQSKPQTLH